jgi:ferredoxin/flavodoxin---NADP+ reductase
VSRLEVDILIVGAGPVGLYGAYYAGVRGLSVAVVGSLSQVGGQVTALYPDRTPYPCPYPCPPDHSLEEPCRT